MKDERERHAGADMVTDPYGLADRHDCTPTPDSTDPAVGWCTQCGACIGQPTQNELGRDPEPFGHTSHPDPPTAMTVSYLPPVSRWARGVLQPRSVP